MVINIITYYNNSKEVEKPREMGYIVTHTSMEVFLSYEKISTYRYYYVN